MKKKKKEVHLALVAMYNVQRILVERAPKRVDKHMSQTKVHGPINV